MFSVSNGLNMQYLILKVQLAYIFSMIQMSRNAHVVFPPSSQHSPPPYEKPKGNPCGRRMDLGLAIHIPKGNMAVPNRVQEAITTGKNQ